MDVYFVRLLILDISIPITIRTQLIRIRVQKEEKSICFSRFGRFSVEFGNFKCVAELTLKDSWLKFVTHRDVVKLRYILAKQTAILLIGAEGDKCRWREIPILVGSQVDWVER